MKNPNSITFQAPPSRVHLATALPVEYPTQSAINIQSQQLCGQRCPSCGRPCRGFAGHDLPHQCNQHHSW